MAAPIKKKPVVKPVRPGLHPIASAAQQQGGRPAVIKPGVAGGSGKPSVKPVRPGGGKPTPGKPLPAGGSGPRPSLTPGVKPGKPVTVGKPMTKPRPMTQAQALAAPAGVVKPTARGGGVGNRPAAGTVDPGKVQPGGATTAPGNSHGPIVGGRPTPATGGNNSGVPTKPGTKPAPSSAGGSNNASQVSVSDAQGAGNSHGPVVGGKPTPGAPVKDQTKHSGIWKPGDKMPGGYTFATWNADPKRPGKYIAMVKDAKGNLIPYPGKKGTSGAGSGSGGSGAAPAPTTNSGKPTFFEGTWGKPGEGYDLTKGTLRGLIRDFNSSTGWSAVDEYGRKIVVTDLKAALKAGWKKLTKEQILAVNPNFYSAGGGVGTGTGTGSAAGGLPSWVSMMFPQIGQPGATTNPTGAGGMNWASLFTGPSAADPQYLQAQSAAIMAAQQAQVDPSAKFKALTAVDPVTGLTPYQADMQAANRSVRHNKSSMLGSAAARGVGSSGMVNSNLANIGTQYAADASKIAAEKGDPALAGLQQQSVANLQSLAMNLYNAYMDSVSRAYEQIPANA